MISTQDRIIVVELINEARENGARLIPACEVLNITDRTYQRWTKEGDIKQDQRPLINRPTPKNKITEEERTQIIEIVNMPEYADLVPSQIVPKLATEGKYIASESTFYRVLKEENLNGHRSRAKVSVGVCQVSCPIPPFPTTSLTPVCSMNCFSNFSILILVVGPIDTISHLSFTFLTIGPA